MADNNTMNKYSQRTESHSFRCNGDVWTMSRERAEKEGVTVSHVINEFLEGYALGKINLPTVIKSYDQ